MISRDWRSKIFEKKKKKNGAPNLAKLGFLQFG